MPSLSSRYIDTSYGCTVYGNCYGSWYYWGRWVLLGIVILFFVVAILFTCVSSRNRVRRGKTPIRGTAWMVPPSYYASEQQYNSAPPIAPPYNKSAGPTDAGYYDQHGNFVSNYPQGYQGYPSYNPNQPQSSGYVPPVTPQFPQSTGSDVYGPPSGPPPGIQAPNSEYYEMANYPPPQTPPPVKQ